MAVRMDAGWAGIRDRNWDVPGRCAVGYGSSPSVSEQDADGQLDRIERFGAHPFRPIRGEDLEITLGDPYWANWGAGLWRLATW
jgi:hypothetical protein